MGAKEKAAELIRGKSTEEIVRCFEITEEVKDGSTLAADVYRVRGWLMDELEKRNHRAFIDWIESDEKSPRKFFINI